MNSDPLPLPQLLNVQQVAERLGVAPSYVRRLVLEKRIPYLKWGHYVRFDPADVAAWLEEAKVSASLDSRRYA